MPSKKVEKVEKKPVKKVEEVVVKKDLSTHDSRNCWHCDQRGYLRCAKGERNEYKFCGIACFNADKTDV